jgi:hypothetical protein
MLETKNDITITISIIALVGTAFTIIYTIYNNKKNYKFNKVKSHSEETQKVYNDWFSVHFFELRMSYPKIIEKIHNSEDWQQKQFPIDWSGILSEKEIKQLIEIMYFFDKVGWLSKAGLINTDFILGPMHRWVLKTWKDIEPMIQARRKIDIINNKGFEELAKYAERYSLEKIIKNIFPQ